VLADAAEPFYIDLHPAPELIAQHLTEPAREALATLRGKLADVAWEKAVLAAAIKETCAAHGLKMPQVAIPLRVALLGQPQTPSIDAVLETMGRELVLGRLDRVL
jgi:glutamyl-tRNA synthetase